MNKANDDTLQAEDVDALADAAGDIAVMMATLVEAVTTMRQMQRNLDDFDAHDIDQAEATVDTWLEEFATFMEGDDDGEEAEGAQDPREQQMD